MADLDNDTHVSKLWFASDDKEHSSKLGGAVEGEERIALLRCLQEFVIVDGKEEGDDDDDHKDNDDNDSSQ